MKKNESKKAIAISFNVKGGKLFTIEEGRKYSKNKIKQLSKIKYL
jgi:hypothetical protein